MKCVKDYNNSKICKNETYESPKEDCKSIL